MSTNFDPNDPAQEHALQGGPGYGAALVTPLDRRRHRADTTGAG